MNGDQLTQDADVSESEGSYRPWGIPTRSGTTPGGADCAVGYVSRLSWLEADACAVVTP